ncbi:dihydrolipoyl dehydrogenase [Candidatus Pantoea edessiphila]|uniref:Dihydrolipoyl dehydrogenase n=1 Tax=Candidatus Pantoea edessiphila TaxID=2044610 RepID=A0A2P5SY49_9GAMM|nr:dihydrolipoyl dehydrogenase [Candidatus Pantoea edessiphila]MBK4775580.1 dihydrolipoyl dehydrogenase [Pantoea sp. Edef]PPI87232.1 dihydrolipoyl dehydrogenase [Candidatus Pantoea edessiphila]
MNIDIKTKVVVIGGGPSGYSAAFRCSDLGLETTIVERYINLGGVCLNVGCIPSKYLLHIAKVIKEMQLLRNKGVNFNDICVDINQIRSRKSKIINNLTNSLSYMAKLRKTKIVNGLGKFIDSNTLLVTNNDKTTTIHFDNAIIAAGSSSIKLPSIPYADNRIWNSTDALNLKEIPKKLLIIGGGIIGLEMATIYEALGSEISIIEMNDQIIPSADEDVIKAFMKIIGTRFKIMLKTKITSVKAENDGIYVSTIVDKDNIKTVTCYDAVLVAVGRIPNSQNLSVEKAGIEVNNNYISVDKQMRTNISHIYAVGDIVGNPMLAHKGIHEGRIAAEVISGLKHYFDPKVIPSISYTDPEVAWIGITEKEANKQGIKYETSIFPWIASGRAIVSQCENGITKLIFDKKTNRIIGGAIVGSNGGELLGEIGLAIEMGCDAEDIALTIHAHPTLSESIGLAAEIFKGTVTDLINTKK